MKKIASLSLLLLFSSLLFGLDFGGMIKNDAAFLKNDPAPFIFENNLDTSLFLKIPFSKDNLSYFAAEGLYRFQTYDGEFTHIVDATVLKFNFSVTLPDGLFTAAIGRFPVSDVTARFFSQPSDGVYLNYYSPGFTASMYTGYTGLINSRLTTMTNMDAYNLIETPVYSLSLPYLMVTGGVSFPYVFLNQTISTDIWGGIALQGVNGNIAEASFVINGPLTATVFHTTSVSGSLVSEDQHRDFGLLATTNITWYLNTLNMSFSGDILYASEKFSTLTATSGFFTSIPWQNIFTTGFTASITPHRTMYLETGVDAVFSATDMQYEGIYLDGNFHWQFFSDTAIILQAAHFFAAEDSLPATKISLGAAISF